MAVRKRPPKKYGKPSKWAAMQQQLQAAKTGVEEGANAPDMQAVAGDMQNREWFQELRAHANPPEGQAKNEFNDPVLMAVQKLSEQIKGLEKKIDDLPKVGRFGA